MKKGIILMGMEFFALSFIFQCANKGKRENITNYKQSANKMGVVSANLVDTLIRLSGDSNVAIGYFNAGVAVLDNINTSNFTYNDGIYTYTLANFVVTGIHNAYYLEATGDCADAKGEHHYIRVGWSVFADAPGVDTNPLVPRLPTEKHTCTGNPCACCKFLYDKVTWNISGCACHTETEGCTLVAGDRCNHTVSQGYGFLEDFSSFILNVNAYPNYGSW